MSTKPKFVRVYDFRKEKRRLKEMEKDAKKYGVDPDQKIDDVAESIVIDGTIAKVEGEATGKLGFPTFTIESHGHQSTWERKAHLSILQKYPKDKLYIPGKRVKLTYGIGSNESQKVSEAYNAKWVLYIDIEK